MTTSDRRGVLYPARLPTFHREPPPRELTGLVRWFWIPEWQLAPGRTSRQEVLSFPASNLTVGADGVTLSGPTTRRSHRDLTGTGWAVGALLRPAAVPALVGDPRAARDRQVPFEATELHRAVTAAMSPDGDGAARRARATAAYSAWLLDRVGPPDAEGELANAMEDAIAADLGPTRVDDLAQTLGISVRSVQRLAQRYVGVTPLAMIRRYRLQEAAQRLRDDPAIPIGQVAAELGYADQAHLCADFRRVLGFTPSTYRDRAGPGDDPSHPAPTG
ncbi:helix-turn-helix domain-containing protein [Rhodococcus zopfii]|uniref:helix-turn-helix domain-containing protein n=1 Tax=Rhodococcus sp. HM1 TaxID=2937759 RepID=UPI00200B91BE|nr:helix-turn-helix transcriptional regulator [Rhodococcus sp. HM1]MCK8671188.1 helix-turn-helix transcriptional regulator [Rhodococcus sp. HM1]